MRSTPIAALLTVAGLLCASPVLAEDHAKMPEKLKAAGFESDYKAALERAKKDGQLVLIYVTPSWFT